MAEFRIRPAVPSDADAIARLSAQLGYPVDPAVMSARLAKLLESATDAILIAETAEGRFAGWIHGFLSQLLESDFRVEVGGLVVEEGLRGQGAGRALLSGLESWARARGAQQVSARCNTLRADSHRFYQRMGYRPTKTQIAFRKAIGSSAI